MVEISPDKIIELADGNIGVVKVLTEIILNNSNAFYKYILQNNMKGPSIYILWNDCCDRDIEFTNRVCSYALTNIKFSLYLQYAIKKEHMRINRSFRWEEPDFYIFADKITCDFVTSIEMVDKTGVVNTIDYVKTHLYSELSRKMIPYVNYNTEFFIDELDSVMHTYKVTGIAIPKKDK